MQLFTAYSWAGLVALRSAKALLLDGDEDLLLSDDMSLWRERLTSQEDRGDLAEYRYAAVVQVDLEAQVIADFLADPRCGRVSEEVAAMFGQLGRPAPACVLQPGEPDVFVLQAIVESASSSDGMAQHYVVRGPGRDPASALVILNRRLTGLTLVGGVAGAAARYRSLDD